MSIWETTSTKSSVPLPVCGSSVPLPKESSKRLCEECHEHKDLTNFPKYDKKHRVSFCRACKRKRIQLREAQNASIALANGQDANTGGSTVPISPQISDGLRRDTYPLLLSRMAEIIGLIRGDPTGPRDQERIDHAFELLMSEFTHILTVTKTFPPLADYES